MTARMAEPAEARPGFLGADSLRGARVERAAAVDARLRGHDD
jgi:hypothetical protein